MKKRKSIIIMGAAGRDFHNFNTYFRTREEYEVIAFTATQIPNIEGRRYPPKLSGKLYPEGIPIYPEDQLISLIKENNVEQVIFSYSDVSHNYLMHKASTVIAAGADFRLMGGRNTMIKSKVPLISICAVRTGVGKSQTTRKVLEIIKNKGLNAVAIRHPMPYGDLTKQICQRFETYEDLKKHNCTIEEIEEYEPHIANGIVVYAGVDYEEIIRQAEKEADVIVWDGGNNDIPFYHPDLAITLADPLRSGHESSYYPGEANIRMSDVIIINKVDSAKPETINELYLNLKELNPKANIIKAESPYSICKPEKVKGKKVLVIEDGPTLTHGEMSFGAGYLAAKKMGASEIIDPRPYSFGSIKKVYNKFKQIGKILPAMGYGEEQIKELQETINKTPCDVVIIGTPIDLRRYINIEKPALRVNYELKVVEGMPLDKIIEPILLSAKK